MELTDGVVTLRPPTADDASMVSAAIQDSLDHLHDYMAWATPEYGFDDALSWASGEVDPGAHPFIVFDESGRMIGTAGLNRLDLVNDRCDIGYWLRPDATGNGYATRAANLLLEYAIGTVGLHRVEIYMSVKNEASRKVAERSKAIYEGRQRDRLKYNGVYHDAHMYALLATD